VFDVGELALLVQTVNSAHIRIFPDHCDVETFVTELNVTHSSRSSGCAVNWSDELHSSFLRSSDIVNIDRSTCKTDC
jgi:hypothetical protein